MSFLSDVFSGKYFGKKIEPEKPKETEKFYTDWDKQPHGRLSYGTGVYAPNPTDPHKMLQIKIQASDADIIVGKIKRDEVSDLSLSLHTTNNANDGSEKIVADVCNALVGSKVKSLSISGKWSEKERLDLFEKLPQTNIQELRIHQYLNPSEIEKMAEVMGQMKLRSFEMNNEFLSDADIKPIIQNLPVSLEVLRLDGSSKLTDDTLGDIVHYLGKTNLRSVAMDQSQVTEKHLPKIVELAKNPDLPPISFHANWSKIPDTCPEMTEITYYRNLKQVSETKKRHLNYIQDRRAVMDKGIHLSEARRSMMLDYARAGRLDEVMERAIRCGRPITAAELTEKQGDNQAALYAVKDRMELAKVFDAKCWTDYNEMQKAWATITRPEHIMQMDGKDGRPNIALLKNKIIQNALINRFKSQKTNPQK